MAPKQVTSAAARTARHVAVLVAAAMVLPGPVVATRALAQVPAVRVEAAPTAVQAIGAIEAVEPFVPGALDASEIDLRAAPVPVPLELRLTSLGVVLPVAGVGITPAGVMDAPTGRAADPVWQQAFWYRGSAVPGEPSTALLAGHVTDAAGRDGAFARLGELRPGDPVSIRDTRVRLDVDFVVTRTASYTLAEATDPAVLEEIYGTGPVSGTRPQASVDGVAHLTLITCTGRFVRGTHDHRLVVFATRRA